MATKREKRLTEKDLNGIEAHMEDHLREAAESHMERLIAEVRWHITNNTMPRDL